MLIPNIKKEQDLLEYIMSKERLEDLTLTRHTKGKLDIEK